MATVQSKASKIDITFWQGMIAQYWKSKEPLPKISGAEVPFRNLAKALKIFADAPLSSSVTVGIFALSIFVLGGFMLILQNVDELLISSATENRVIIYLKDEIKTEELELLKKEIEAEPTLRFVEYLSKKQALKIFAKELGEESMILSGFDDTNPLPASIEVELRQDDVGVNKAEEALKKVTSYPFVDDISHMQQYIESMQSALRIMRVYAYIGLLLIFLIAASLIAGTIKMIISFRSEEIKIMNLIGADKNFIVSPFVISGVLKGLCGVLLGLMLVGGLFYILNYQLGTLGLAYYTSTITFLPIPLIILLLMGGGFAGALGSYLTIRKIL